MIRIRVGIVVWNTADLLDRCLTALPAALKGADASVVVVDNASSDGSAEIVSRHPGVELIRNNTNRGYARAMNQALAGADTDVLIALNPDTEPPPGSLSTLADRLLAAPDVGLVAPRLTGIGGDLQHSVYRFPSPAVLAAVCFAPISVQQRGLGSRFWLEGHSAHNESQDIDWAIGAVHVMRPISDNGAGPYNERWFMYVEDLDLCWQLARDGWRRRLESDIAVPHVGNAAGALAWGDQRTARWQWATYDWYGLRHGPWALRGYAATNLVGSAVVLFRLGFRAAIGRGLNRPLARRLVAMLPIHARVAMAGRVSPGHYEQPAPN